MELARIKAKVISGKGRGKGLGIPTINFEIPATLTIAHGVYAARVLIDGKIYPTALHFGPRPAFDEDDISLEAYLLQGLLDKKPEEAEIVFISYIRPIKNFDSPDQMLQQIDKDVRQITSILSQ